jgi:hypothetical protein
MPLYTFVHNLLNVLVQAAKIISSLYVQNLRKREVQQWGMSTYSVTQGFHSNELKRDYVLYERYAVHTNCFKLSCTSCKYCQSDAKWYVEQTVYDSPYQHATRERVTVRGRWRERAA